MRINNVRNDPLKTIQNLIAERYSLAKAVFWAGSVSQNQGTKGSDLDLIIVFESLPHAYREAFIYDGWPIDAFIHDLDSLRYFTKTLEAHDGRPALIHMIINGHEILDTNDFGKSVKLIAHEALSSGPDEWSQDRIDKERFLITDVLDDIKFPKNHYEQITSAIHLFEPLIQFYFRAQKKWAASGKSLLRYLKMHNPDLALEFNQSFDRLFQMGEVTGIESIVQKILSPYGGLLWDGFRSDAPKEWKSNHKSNVLEELKAMEPIFHHPDKFGKSEQAILAQMCDEFYEVGASGNLYTKQDIIKTLLERYNDTSYKDVWEIKDFELIQIAPDNYLVTYILIQEETRVTRRSTIWRKVNGSWKALYHQGTVAR